MINTSKQNGNVGCYVVCKNVNPQTILLMALPSRLAIVPFIICSPWMSDAEYCPHQSVSQSVTPSVNHA